MLTTTVPTYIPVPCPQAEARRWPMRGGLGKTGNGKMGEEERRSGREWGPSDSEGWLVPLSAS